MTDLVVEPAAVRVDEPSSLSDGLVRLTRVLHALKSSATSDRSPEGRERAAYHLLFPICRSGPLRQGALSELLHTDPSTISRHVTVLVEAGLVRRVADDQDGRVSRLVATEAGAAVLTTLREQREAMVARCTDGWTAAELAEFTRQLHRFVDDLGSELPAPNTTSGTTTNAERVR